MKFRSVTVTAYVFLIAGSFALFAADTAGPGYGLIANAAPRAVFWAMVAPSLGPALAIWLVAVWALFRRNRLWRNRAWIAIAPPVLFLVYRVGFLVVDPPSPQKYFHQTFGVYLPSKFRVIEVAHPTMADPGLVEYAILCSKQCTQSLVERMNLDPVTTEPRAPFVNFRIAREWNWDAWRTPNQYAKTQRTGTGHILVADGEMERILVCRNPGFAKSEAENPLGTYKD